MVVRSYLRNNRDKRIKRMVMLGVPNRGAQMADRLKQGLFYKTILGPAGQQLASDPEGFIARLPTPDFEFAVIAGGRGNMTGYNPLIPGDDDGTVGVSSTRLPGATDFAVANCLHSFLVTDKTVVEQTVRFLQSGRLRRDGPPHPIPRGDSKDKNPAGQKRGPAK